MFRFTQERSSGSHFLCLAKTTVMVVYPRRLWRDQCHGSIPTCCAGVRYTVEKGTLILLMHGTNMKGVGEFLGWEYQTYDEQIRRAKIKVKVKFASVSKRQDIIPWSSRDLTAWPQRKTLHFSLDSIQYGSQSWCWARKQYLKRRADEEHSSSQQPQNGSGKQNILGWH
jgi:hypothetical protein